MDIADKLLDRATYRKIKGYTKDEMADFCNRIYMSGKKSAFDEINLEQIRLEIAAIKGIGEVKLSQIMEIVEKSFDISDTDK